MTQTEILINDVYEPYLEDKSRFLVLYGGSGSGKSVFAAQKIALRFIQEQPHKLLILRKVGTDLKLSVIQEIKDALSIIGVYDLCEYNKQDKILTYPNGNQIIFRGLDEPERVKSIKDITGMWIEEATEFTEEDFDQLNLRIRGETKNYVQYILTFNPIDEDHWLRQRIANDSDFTVLKTTHKDNYFLSSEDREQIEKLKERNPTYYDIYCLGEWGKVDKSGKFMHNFNQNKHVANVELNPNLPIWLSFDFNLDPMSALICQIPDTQTGYVIEKIRLEESDIFEVTDRIKTKYPGAFFLACGDASGKNRTGTTRGKTSYWKIIKNELNLKDHQLYVRNQNLGIIESRTICNAALTMIDIKINQSCKELIEECKYAKVDDYGILIKDRKKNKNDFLDAFRYFVDINWQDVVSKPFKYKKSA